MAEYIYEDGLKLRQKVRAVVADAQGRVLLVRPHGYAEDDWALAGGGVESGESALEAIRREIAEELGITETEVLLALPVRNRFIFPEEYKRRRELDHDGQNAAMYYVRISNPDCIRPQDEEIAAFAWFEPEDAVRAFPVAKQREIFQACMAAIDTEPAVSQQQAA